METIDVAVIRQAIRDQRKLRVQYRSLNGESSTRIVWPVVIGYAETSRLLVAWCELRQDFRHFRTEGMLAIEVSENAIGVRAGELRRRWENWRNLQIIDH